jgi:hypothetical protein
MYLLTVRDILMDIFVGMIVVQILAYGAYIIYVACMLYWGVTAEEEIRLMLGLTAWLRKVARRSFFIFLFLSLCHGSPLKTAH